MSFLERLFGRPDEGDPDARVIEQLRASGADLSKPRPVDHFLYFATESGARRTAARLNGTGGEVRIAPGGLGRRWLVQVTLDMVITLERIAALRTELEALAATEGGEYDGWGASAG